MLRREFLVTAAATACHSQISRSLFAVPTCVEGTDIPRNPDCPIPYENNIRDRMWMWGHDSGSLGNYISVEGLIFHCTPLCDMGLEAVEYSRRWIDEHGEEPVGCAELAPIRD